MLILLPSKWKQKRNQSLCWRTWCLTHLCSVRLRTRLRGSLAPGLHPYFIGQVAFSTVRQKTCQKQLWPAPQVNKLFKVENKISGHKTEQVLPPPVFLLWRQLNPLDIVQKTNTRWLKGGQKKAGWLGPQTPNTASDFPDLEPKKRPPKDRECPP